MKTKFLFSGLLLSAFALGSSAQTLPAYTIDYVLNSGEGDNGFGANWADLLDSWEPGDAYSTKGNYKDDNFFISRVRPRTRIQNSATQVDPSRKDERKMLWWCPVGESSKVWGPFQRFNFDADNFSMWSYLDYHGNWSNGWIRVPGVFNDVAHKNGVKTGCLIFFEGSSDPNLPKLVTKNGDGSFKYLKTFLNMLWYYGIDGVGVNPEGSIGSTSTALKEFFGACHEEAKKQNRPFEVIWYEAQTNGGTVSWTDQLSQYNDDWFDYDGKVVSDAYFLNYNWASNGSTTKLETTMKTLKDFPNRSSYDVYAGMDIEGRGLHNNAGSNGGWMKLKDYPLSIGLWGNHADNMIHKNSNENGSSDLAIQEEYQTKLEMFFSGGNRNPASLPELSNANRAFSMSDLKTFHGIEYFINAKSTINEVPFVTRFNLGNGQFFNNEGETTFPNKWYNIGMQDFLPTWRWWITDSWATDAKVPEDAIAINFTFDDAWYGGSSLEFSGATTVSNIRMFKTALTMPSDAKITLTYKMVNGGTDPKMSLCVSKVGSENNFSEFKLPSVEKEGEWYTATVKMSDLSLNADDVVACIGLKAENTAANYQMLLGELSITDPAKVYSPAAITIDNAEVLGGQFNADDVKASWTCGDKSFNSETGLPVYNDEVDTWFFEIYTRNDENSEPVLSTATTTWAGYVIGAPAVVNSKTVQIGICPVAPDGTRGEITWSEPMERIVKSLETIVIDKPIIKPNQEFTISFLDETHADSKFTLYNALTDGQVYTGEGKSITTKLPDLGYYDLKVGEGENAVMYRAFVQITPESTGRMPEVTEITVDKNSAKTGETVTFAFDGELGDGSVSRGLHLSDVECFTIPKEIMSKRPFTVATWVKLDLNVLYGTEGTAFFNQRDYTDGWPTAEWGDSWFDFRFGNDSKGDGPDHTGELYLHACILSGTNINNVDYSLTPGVWAHVAMTLDDTNKLSLYLNGHLAASGTSGSGYRGKGTVYFGGSAANRSGFVGTLDEIQIWNKALSNAEIQEAMSGYNPSISIPEGLVGYWRFENNPNSEGVFVNEGSMTGVDGRVTNKKDNKDVTVMSPQFATGTYSLRGKMEVSPEITWNLPGTSSVKQDDDELTAEAVYGSVGTFDAKVTVKNVYGSSVKEVKEIISVTQGSGIEDAAAASTDVYPNPFENELYVNFAESGAYTVQVYSLAGNLVSEQGISAAQGDVVRVTVDAAPGTYLVKVLNKDAKAVKTVKVIKK